jgi:hypothetical protein
MNEQRVKYLAAQSSFRFSYHPDLVIVTTDTGRTYAIENDNFSCMVKDGEFMSHSRHFLLWLLDLEKPKS